jgi:thymidylate kinase
VTLLAEPRADRAGLAPRNTVRRDAAPHALVVELFGPAAAGKTTFARALHDALREAGCHSELLSSARPAERPGPAPRMRLLAPLSRAAKLFRAVLEAGSTDPVGARLRACFPPASAVMRLRNRRYLLRLARALAAPRPPGSVLILDQGYLSALCSMAARSGAARRAEIEPVLAQALGLVPRADLVIWMETPAPLLQARLRERLARQPWAERVFEPDLAALAQQARLARALRGLLEARGGRLLEAQGQAGRNDDIRRARDAVLALGGPGAGPGRGIPA